MCSCVSPRFSGGVAVCLSHVGWIAKQSRADGFIMRKQNDSDNDDQIIILHLKEECVEVVWWITKKVEWMRGRGCSKRG